jgi:hypothetical protein
MERIIDRFDIYMKLNRLNDNIVSEKLGLSNGLLGKSRKNNRDLSKKVVDKILDNYSDISKIWLFTGEGNMSKKEISQIGESNFYNSKGDQNINTNEGQKLRIENQC